MRQRRALLIQDAKEFMEWIRAPYQLILPDMIAQGYDPYHVTLYIVRECIHRQERVFDPCHYYVPTLMWAFNQLNHLLEGRLEDIFNHYFKIPLMYDDHVRIHVVMRDRDLWIHYYG